MISQTKLIMRGKQSPAVMVPTSTSPSLFISNSSVFSASLSMSSAEIPSTNWLCVTALCTERVLGRTLSSHCCSGNTETPGSGQDKQVEQLLRLQRHLADPSHQVLDFHLVYIRTLCLETVEGVVIHSGARDATIHFLFTFWQMSEKSKKNLKLF